MNNKNFQSEILRRVEEALNSLPKERFKNIVKRRFGLENGNRETLQAIGQNYGITRERVRQIESDALKILTKRQNLSIFKPIFEYLDKLFEEYDYLVGEQRLLDSITNTEESHPARSAVIMVLTLGSPYQRFAECNEFFPHWATKKSARTMVQKIVDSLVDYLKEQNRVYSSSDILDFLLSKHKNISKNAIQNALDISKNIDKNIFGELGLSHWAEINPRGVREKAYLVLRRKAKPNHFTKITDLINEANFSNRQTFPQTVHNELIKDDRFILIGRGTYALREWGYEPGTVKEVIAKILSEAQKPFTKKEIISAVLQKRQVKPNTIVINLQNNAEFEKLENGKFRLC